MAKKRGVGIGVDVGGTFVKLAAVERGGRCLRVTQLSTQPGHGPREFVRRVSAAAGQLASALGRPVLGAGVGIAGDVDCRGRLRFSPNLRSFEGFDFKRAFHSSLRVPVAVYNDARMAAWGGYVAEFKRRSRNVLCVTLGTGVGGGLILNGRLYLGADGTAGEIGHMTVEPAGELCHCGTRGCLEAYAGSYGIVRTAQKLLKGSGGAKSALARLNPDSLDPPAVEAAASKGDRLARAVWNVTGYYLGVGLANLVYALNLDDILIAGGVSRAGGLILNPILETFKSQPLRTPFRRVRVRLARESNLGAVGAALAGLETEAF